MLWYGWTRRTLHWVTIDQSTDKWSTSNEAEIGLQRPASTMRTHTRDTGKPFQKKISSRYGSRETTQGIMCSLIIMSTWTQILNCHIKDKCIAGVCNPSRARAGRAGKHSPQKMPEYQCGWINELEAERRHCFKEQGREYGFYPCTNI